VHHIPFDYISIYPVRRGTDKPDKLIVSVFSGKGPPVPIPNTEVKLASADDTRLETDRENRSMLTQ
jgi:hypothetical protein